MAMTSDTIVVVVTAVANAGALIYLGRRALDKIDQHSQAIAPMVEALKTLAAGQRELFESRNDHERRLTEGETVRKLNGCDLPQDSLNRRASWPPQN